MLEDDSADAELTRFALRRGGLHFSLSRVETKEEYEPRTRRAPAVADSVGLFAAGVRRLRRAGHRAGEVSRKRRSFSSPARWAKKSRSKPSRAERRITCSSTGCRGWCRRCSGRCARPRSAPSTAARRNSSANRTSNCGPCPSICRHVREEERTRIAREVHDELGQALTSCKLDLSWIAGKLPRELKPLQEKAQGADGAD